MTLFRPHRGGLAESMAECVEVNSLEDIRQAVLVRGELSARPYGYDARIDWDTYIITDGIGVVGFADGPLETLK